MIKGIIHQQDKTTLNLLATNNPKIYTANSYRIREKTVKVTIILRDFKQRVINSRPPC